VADRPAVRPRTEAETAVDLTAVDLTAEDPRAAGLRAGDSRTDRHPAVAQTAVPADWAAISPRRTGAARPAAAPLPTVTTGSPAAPHPTPTRRPTACRSA